MSKDYKNELKDMYRLMNYGLNESKSSNNNKAIVEYSQLGADGKTYGILREGNKYFIKVAPKKNTAVLAEDYDYIGGFNNRKAYDSYTKASQELNFKLMSVNESSNSKKNVSQYKLNESAEWQVNETKEMRGELNRFYQLVSNVDNLLNENVHYISENSGCKNAPFCEKPTEKDGGGHKGQSGKQQQLGIKEKDWTSNNSKVNAEKDYNKYGVKGGSPSGEYKMSTPVVDENGGNPYQNKAKASKEQGKSISENVEDWRRGFVHDGEEELVDRSHGTEIGDRSPWTENVNEECDDWGSCGLPGTPGIGDAKKYKKPFEKNTKQPVSEQYIFEVELGGTDENVDLSIPDGMNVSIDGEEGFEDNDMEPMMDDDEPMDGEESMMDDESMMNDMQQNPQQPMMGNNMQQQPMPQQKPMGQNQEQEPMMNEGYIFEVTLDDFGKHPAYRKKPMTLPQKGGDSEWGRDWNDESTKGEEPYGKKIGHGGDPFSITVDKITDALVTALSKKKE